MASGRGAASGAMSGAAAGAATGMASGSGGGPIGAGIGAGLGALLGLFGRGGEKPMSPELEALYKQQLQQQYETNPMYEAVLRLAYSRMPTGVRGEGPSLERALGELGPDLSQAGTGDYAEAPMVRQTARLMQLRQQMAKPLQDAVRRLAMQRMPRGFQGGLTPRGVGPFDMPPGNTGSLPENPDDERNRG
jgi:hypothetical protein